MTASYLAPIGVVFLGLFGVTSWLTSSLLAPAPLWNLLWFVSFMTSAIFGQGFIYDARAMILVALVAALFNLGCLLGSASPKVSFRSARLAKIPSTVTCLCLLVSLAGLVSLSRDLGTSILSVRSFSSLLSLGQQNAVAIFRGEASLGGMSKLAFSLMQFGFAIAGSQWRLSRSRSSTAILAGLVLVAFMWSALTTQRSYLLVPIVWWIGGYVASTCWAGSRIVAPRVLVRGLIILGGLVLLVVWLRSVRTGGTAAVVNGSAFSSSLPWLAGYLPAFSVWYLNGSVITDGQVPGFFGGITGLIGTKATGQSGGNEYIGAQAFSNAPTMMRDVFALGGPVWAAFTVILLGLAAHVAYNSALRGQFSGAAVYAGVVCFILWAPNAWFFSYGGRMLTWLLLIASGVIIDRRRRSRSVNYHKATQLMGQSET